MGLSIEFLTKTPKKIKTTWMFLKKLTNWSLHKLENSLEWSIISNQQANFINFNPIEQNPQIGFKTNPRIFNCSQNPKLIKLTNIYHEYNNIGAKPNDQFQKKRIDSTKIPILKSSENSLKMHGRKTKGRVERSYWPCERKTLQKLGWKRQKTSVEPCQVGERERKVWKSSLNQPKHCFQKT